MTNKVKGIKKMEIKSRIKFNDNETKVITDFMELVFQIVKRTNWSSQKIFEYLKANTDIEFNYLDVKQPSGDVSQILDETNPYTCTLDIDEIDLD